MSTTLETETIKYKLACRWWSSDSGRGTGSGGDTRRRCHRALRVEDVVMAMKGGGV